MHDVASVIKARWDKPDESRIAQEYDKKKKIGTSAIKTEWDKFDYCRIGHAD